MHAIVTMPTEEYWFNLVNSPYLARSRSEEIEEDDEEEDSEEIE